MLGHDAASATLSPGLAAYGRQRLVDQLNAHDRCEDGNAHDEKVGSRFLRRMSQQQAPIEHA
jgi:hypothetical protein